MPTNPEGPKRRVQARGPVCSSPLAASTRLFSPNAPNVSSFWSPGFDDGPLCCACTTRRRRHHHLVTYHHPKAQVRHRHGSEVKRGATTTRRFTFRHPFAPICNLSQLQALPTSFSLSSMRMWPPSVLFVSLDRSAALSIAFQEGG